MKAGTLAAAAIAIAMATTGCVVLPPIPLSEESKAKFIACVQEAIATKTGRPPEETGILAAAFVNRQSPTEESAIEFLGLAGELEPETCPSGWGRVIADIQTKDEWIEDAEEVRVGLAKHRQAAERRAARREAKRAASSEPSSWPPGR